VQLVELVKHAGAEAMAKLEVKEKVSAKSPPLQVVPVDATARLIVSVGLDPPTTTAAGAFAQAAGVVLPVVVVAEMQVVAQS
jgi:hypothetical protein